MGEEGGVGRAAQPERHSTRGGTQLPSHPAPRAARKSEFLFVIVFTAISPAFSATADAALTALGFEHPDRPELLKFGIRGLFVKAVIFAPLLETLLFQQIPILLGRWLRLPVGVQLLMGAIPFAASHFGSGVVTGVAPRVVGGLFYSVAYLTFLGRSKARAFVATASVHALHNLVACVFIARELA